MSAREATERPPLRITKLELTDGYWTAHVSSNGTTIRVDRRFGSWQAERRSAPRSRRFVRCDVRPFVAAELQRKVRALERRAKREVVA